MALFQRDKNKKKLETIDEVVKYAEALEKKIENLSNEIEHIKKEGKFAVQKIGMVRYNPFSGIGGDQSFSIAMLNADNDGVVITGIFSNEGNRVYAKPVEKGGSKYLLSDEEKEAIKKVTNKKILQLP